MVKLTVNFINETKVSINQRPIEESLKLILRRLDHLGKVNMELLMVGDSKIKKLNIKYLNTKRSTDVLSFPAAKYPHAHEDFTASVVVSVDTAKKQAKQAGITLEKELQTLAGHGLLHLLEFHHK